MAKKLAELLGISSELSSSELRGRMIAMIEIEAADAVMPITALCEALGVERATVYHHRECCASASETGVGAQAVQSGNLGARVSTER